MLAGCGTVAPVTQTFPVMPLELSAACKPLVTIEGETTTLSKLMDTVAKNYSSRHDCAAQVESIKEWHQEQKKIFDEANE